MTFTHRSKPDHLRQGMVLLITATALVSLGCHRPTTVIPKSRSVLPHRALPRLGFSIQVGAFAQVENAARLSQALQARGLDATYYAASTGLYRVRFGDFPTRETARSRAVALQAAGVISDFYLVKPEEPPLLQPIPQDAQGLRDNLAATARSYLGVPYLWGGTSTMGFDCSGLTMSVYRLNGLRLARTCLDQYEAGTPVSLDRLQEGDLLFFATGRSRRITHVGICVGNGTFIHAPSHGKTIRTDSMDNRYFKKAFVGARTYL